jgi:hypothetical protein
MGKRAAVATALTGLLLLTGCTGDSDDKNSPAVKAGDEDSITENVAADAAFGEPFEFEDGLAIQVTEPKQFRPSANATTGGEPNYVGIKVRVVNETGRKFSPAQVSITVESDDGQAGDVIDAKKKMMASPPRKAVKPGEQVAWNLGFGVLDPKDVAVEVQVGMDREPVTFAG